MTKDYPESAVSITIIDLDAIEVVYNAASPGPWRQAYNGTNCKAIVQTGDDDHVCDAYDNTSWSEDQCRANADFIASSRTVIPALVGYARQLEEGLPGTIGDLIEIAVKADRAALADKIKQLDLHDAIYLALLELLEVP